MKPEITTSEQSAIYALRIMELEAAIKGVITAYEKPHYGDYEVQSDNVFVAVEVCRKLLAVQ